MNKLADIIEDGEYVITQAMQWDMEIAKDDLHYSSWISGLSSAGIAIVLLNHTKFVDTTNLYPVVLDVLLTIAMVCFLAGLVTGALVKRHVSAVLELSRQIMTSILGQKILLKYDDNLAKEFESEEALKIMSGISSGEYMPSHMHDEWDRLHKKLDKFKKYYNKEYRVQEVAVVGGYFIVVFLGAPIFRNLVSIPLN